MATLTIRLSDEKHERLHQMAKQRKISINKLMEKMSDDNEAAELKKKIIAGFYGTKLSDNNWQCTFWQRHPHS